MTRPADEALGQSIALVRRYVDALNSGDMAALDALFADDFVIHQAAGDRHGKRDPRDPARCRPVNGPYASPGQSLGEYRQPVRSVNPYITGWEDRNGPLGPMRVLGRRG